MAKIKTKRRRHLISLTKEKMHLTVTRENPIDRTDPNPVGITADELVATVEGISLRRIRYTHPATADADEFLTSEFTRPPGVIAFRYLRRWDLEKVFDELKNKLGPSAPGPTPPSRNKCRHTSSASRTT